MKIKKILLSAFMTLSFFFPLTIHAARLPEPTNDFYVNDFADVLNDETEQKIDRINAELESINGSQLVVTTVDFLDGMAIDDYAVELFNKWQIGSQANNGVLLLLAIAEDNYYCIQGSGIESLLSSGRIQLILDYSLEPDFAAGNYSDGVDKTVDEIYNVLKTAESGTIIDNENNSVNVITDHLSIGSHIASFISTIFTLIIIMAVISSIFRPRRRYYRPIRPRYYGGFGYPHHHHHHNHRSTYTSRPSSFSSSRGAGRSSFSSGSHHGGGGSTRGGGAGRH